MATTKKAFERLPTNVAPKNYALTLQPNLTEFTFTGKEVIDVEVMQKINPEYIKCRSLTYVRIWSRNC